MHINTRKRAHMLTCIHKSAHTATFRILNASRCLRNKVEFSFSKTFSESRKKRFFRVCKISFDFLIALHRKPQYSGLCIEFIVKRVKWCVSITAVIVVLLRKMISLPYKSVFSFSLVSLEVVILYLNSVSVSLKTSANASFFLLLQLICTYYY